MHFKSCDQTRSQRTKVCLGQEGAAVGAAVGDLVGTPQPVLHVT